MDVIKQNDPTVYSSNNIWSGITVADYHLAAATQINNQQVQGHRIAFNIGEPLFVRWKENNIWQYTVYETGAFGLVPDGEYNDINWNKDLHVIVIALKPDYVEQIFDRGSININQHRGVYDQTAYEIAILLRNEIKHGALAGKVLGESLAVAFTTHLITRYANLQKSIVAPKGKLSGKQLKQVIAYCNDTTQQSLTLQEMSGQACLSMFHFVRMFKQTIGVTPCQYVLQIKIEKAIQLLKESNKPLNEIACILGFADPAHFSNAFKKTTGLSLKNFGRSN